MSYEDLVMKKLSNLMINEDCSSFVVHSIEKVIKDAMDSGQNEIVINTNLRLGIPMENVNKIAGLLLEAWVFEKFQDGS